jgi:hypothetical protein
MSIYIRENQLSPEAVKEMYKAPNKSLFVREAIEFYVHYGKNIQNELKEMKELLLTVLNTNITDKNQSNILYNNQINTSNFPRSNNNESTKSNIQDTQNNKISDSKEILQQKSENKIESLKSNIDITEDKKKDIEKQILRSINMIL